MQTIRLDSLEINCTTPCNVVRGNQMIMQRKSVQYQPAMTYGSENYVNNKVSAPVLSFFFFLTVL